VVKADGLAAGKGVLVTEHLIDAEDDVRAKLAGTSFGEAGRRVVIEEGMVGPELSVLAVCDGRRAVALAPAQDFKRAYDGDEGPNTGGMGSYAPVPGLGEAEVEELLQRVHVPVLRELAARGAPFVGCLYAGLMLTTEGPRVLEFNCRFGDPETQSLLPLLEGDLLGALAAAASGDLAGVGLAAGTGAAVTVVLAASGYPEAGDRGSEISGIANAEAGGALVFHAGTALHDGRLTTSGGRILDVVGTGPTLAVARAAAYGAAEQVTFQGARYRRDVALAAASGAGVAI
jgi:phosphoribosylamine--glycine ligase